MFKDRCVGVSLCVKCGVNMNTIASLSSSSYTFYEDVYHYSFSAITSKCRNLMTRGPGTHAPIHMVQVTPYIDCYLLYGSTTLFASLFNMLPRRQPIPDPFCVTLLFILFSTSGMTNSKQICTFCLTHLYQYILC